VRSDLDREDRVSGKSWGIENDKKQYLRWLEEMWDVHKFDLHGRTEREEKRKEEVLKIFEGLGEISGRRVEVPDFPPWEPSRW
jgi:hypothetical protein